MQGFTLMDGLVITIVAMGVVFVVLAALWGLTELVHKLSAESDTVPMLENPVVMQVDKEREVAATIAALVAAHEANPAKNYEIVEIKRVK